MYFTREPLIETVITPREGYKLVVKSTRNHENDEYFVDALEVVSFGQALFFRSMERPKCFLVPVSDYEVMEVRETRLILKASPLEKGVKIGGGREAQIKSQKEDRADDDEMQSFESIDDEEELHESHQSAELVPSESKIEKKRERRRHRRKKLRGDEKEESSSVEIKAPLPVDDLQENFVNSTIDELPLDERPQKSIFDTPHHFGTLIPPPPNLISETLNAYRNQEQFKKAFIQTKEEVAEEIISQEEPSFSEDARHENLIAECLDEGYNHKASSNPSQTHLEEVSLDDDSLVFDHKNNEDKDTSFKTTGSATLDDKNIS
jgi:hypothetical protein